MAPGCPARVRGLHCERTLMQRVPVATFCAASVTQLSSQATAGAGRATCSSAHAAYLQRRPGAMMQDHALRRARGRAGVRARGTRRATQLKRL
jgi:hypothetical protein